MNFDRFLADDIENSTTNIEKVSLSDIAIIGISAVMPEAEDVYKFWDNLYNKKNVVQPMKNQRAEDVKHAFDFIGEEYDINRFSKCSMINQIDKFDYKYFNMSKNEAIYMDPNQRLFLQTAWNAFEDAGYGGDLLKGSDTGVYVAVNSNYAVAYSALTNQESKNTFQYTGSIESMISGRLSFLKDFHGPSMIIETACSSSLVCLHTASQAIRNGECSMALVGGANICMLPLQDDSVGIQAKDGITRSFDIKASGTGIGEGVIALVIKSYVDAVQDKDCIYAIIKGSAVNQDGQSLTNTAPNPKAQEKVILKAWEMANINPEEISYIETHGTATHIGDPIEIESLKKAFSRYTDRKQFCGIGSVKSNIGHLGNLAGLAGVLKMVLALKHKTLPATLHFNCPNHDYNIHNSAMYIVDESCEWKVSTSQRICGISSFGISGTNCHMVIAEANDEKPLVDEDGMRDVFSLSAKNMDSLQQMLTKYTELIDEEKMNYHDFCYTVNTGKGVYDHRIAIIIDSITKLKRGLIELTERGLQIDSYSDNIYCSWCAEYSASYYQTNDEVEQLCENYVKGIPIDWMALYHGKVYNRLHTPGYSFYPYRCWALDESKQSENMSYHTVWRTSEFTNDMEKTPTSYHRSILVIARGNQFAKNLITKYQNLGYQVIPSYIYTDISNTKVDLAVLENPYIVMKQLIEEVDVENLEKIIISGTIFETGVETIEDLRGFVNYEVKCLFYLTSLLESSLKHSIDLYILSDSLFWVTHEEKYLKSENSMLFSIGKSMNLENKYTRFHCIDFDELTSIDTVIREIESRNQEVWICYRNEERYLEELEPVEFTELSKDSKVQLVKHGAYVITGGNGFVGSQMVKRLAEFPDITVVILSRTLEYNEKLLSNGTRLVQYPVNISDEQALNNVLEILRTTYGEIHGIIHCAGIVRQGKVLKERNYFEDDILEAKVYGTWLLSQLTSKDPIDFFISCSSFITLIGGMSSCEYAIANTFVDAFNELRLFHHKNSLTINWGTFEESVKNVEKYNNFIFKPMKTQKALDVWSKLFRTYQGRLFIGEFNYDLDYMTLKQYVPFLLSSKIENKIRINKDVKKLGKCAFVDLCGRTDEMYSRIEIVMANIIGNELGVESMSVDDNFFELGVTSILAVQIEMEAQKYNIPIEYKYLYSYPTLRSLATFIKNGMSSNDIENKEHAKKETVVNECANSVDDKVILQVQPFDQFIYRDCFYNSLLSVIGYYHIKLLHVLTAAIPEYIMNQDNQLIDIDYVEKETFNELIKEMGLRCDNKNITKELIGELKNYVNQGVPIILWVDSFYEPFIKDTYNQEHIHHTIVVCGYSDERKEVYVIDHTQKNSLNYRMQVMSYEQLELAFYENINRFGPQYGMDTFIVIEKQLEMVKTIDTLRYEYLQFLKKEHHRVRLGIHYLELFIKNMKASTQNNIINILKANQDIIELFNKIVQSKVAEEYKISYLFEKDHMVNSKIENLRKLWTAVRALIVKVIYSTKIDIYIIDEMIKLMEDILQLEYEYIDCLNSLSL